MIESLEILLYKFSTHSYAFALLIQFDTIKYNLIYNKNITVNCEVVYLRSYINTTHWHLTYWSSDSIYF